MKITTITGLLSTPLEVDADKSWESYLSESPRGRLECTGAFHFQIHLPWMDLPDAIKTKFWDLFNNPEAERTRAVAIYGLTRANYEIENLFVHQCMDFYRNRHAGAYKDKLDDATADSMAVSFLISEIVAKRDVSALRRIITILEMRGIPEGNRGGYGSDLGYMLEKFTELHAASRSLPTKAELRKACGMNSLEDKKQADKMMRKIGLSGLPTELEI